VPIVTKSLVGHLSPILVKPVISPVSATSLTYWCENGVVYQLPSAGSSATIVVGFQNYTGFVQYCQRTTNWRVAPATFYGRTAFSSQDFPVAQDVAPNPNPTPLYDQYQVFASQNAASLATSFLNSAGITTNGNFRATTVYTLITWAQAAALAVQSPQGAQTVSLAYLTLSQSQTAKLGTEIIWLGPPLS
jgi:hypothetical protein